MPQIKVTVSPTGEVVIATTGYKGKACQDATSQMEKALGVVASDKKAPEFYASESQSQQAGQ